MGTKGKEIVNLDVEKLLELLNKALADEWLAYYQYWVGSEVVKGPMRPSVEKELKEHAEEEFKHAGMLVERIIQLGGTPLLNPKEWFEKTNCDYEVPSDPHTVKLLQQNIKGEQCAIQVYHNILEFIKKGNDPITFNMIRKIMEEEVEHEQDLEDLLDDINTKREL
ncbi:MAG: ferritin [Candidatus Lokiarchaeota archaeon]|nr:ferritin [Candidatus Lokiarchaeota archaeon]